MSQIYPGWLEFAMTLESIGSEGTSYNGRSCSVWRSSQRCTCQLYHCFIKSYGHVLLDLEVPNFRLIIGIMMSVAPFLSITL